MSARHLDSRQVLAKSISNMNDIEILKIFWSLFKRRSKLKIMQLAQPLKTELFESYWYGAIDKIKQLCANIDVVVILSEKFYWTLRPYAKFSLLQK